MKRPSLNFIIDSTAFAGFVVLTTTGVLMRYILPPGSGHYATVWGMDRHEWGAIHFWIAVFFFATLALHLVLHWRWIKSFAAGRPSEGSGFRIALGLVGITAVLALAVSPLLTSVARDPSSKRDTSFSIGNYQNIAIRGSMTLKEAAETAGVPVSYLISALNLPETISTKERLCLLKRQYGFEINDVKEIVKQHNNSK